MRFEVRIYLLLCGCMTTREVDTIVVVLLESGLKMSRRDIFILFVVLSIQSTYLLSIC